MIYGLLFVNIILLVLGQTLWKIGIKSLNSPLSASAILKLMINPYIVCGILIYGAATIIWIYILSKSELSMIYPMQSLCYVFAAFIGMFVFKEFIPLTRWFGIFLIISGAYFVSLR